MNGQLHGAPHGRPHGGSHGHSVRTVVAKTRQGTTPHRTAPDLSSHGSPFHHVVAYVTRESGDGMDAATRRRFA